MAMPLIKIAGVQWDPHLVGWGLRGRPRKDAPPGKELLGYWPKKDGRGKLSNDDRDRRTIDFWNCHAVYALFERGQAIYVGEGKLGDRLFKHWREDTLVGRWDAFTWVSPDSYDLAGDGKASLAAAAEGASHQATTKQWIELMELIAIRLGSPSANSQLPKSAESIKWMEQVKSENSTGSLEAKVDKILQFLEDLD